MRVYMKWPTRNPLFSLSPKLKDKADKKSGVKALCSSFFCQKIEQKKNVFKKIK